MRENYDVSDEIIEEIKLRGDAKLHRVVNQKGEKFSIITIGDREIWSCFRLNEADMIKRWNQLYGR